MNKATFVALRTFLAVLFLGSLLVQVVLMPLAYTNLTDVEPAVHEMRAGVFAVVFLLIVMTQTVGVCVWRLVTLVRGDRIFTVAALGPVNMIVAAVMACAGLVFGMGALLAPGETVAPGVVLLLGVVSAVIAGVALLAYVVRNLLEEVIAHNRP